MQQIRIPIVFCLFFVSKFAKNDSHVVNCDFLRVFLHFVGASDTDLNGDLFISKNVQIFLVILENRYNLRHGLDAQFVGQRARGKNRLVLLFGGQQNSEQSREFVF